MTNDEIMVLLEKNRAAIEKQDQLHAQMEQELAAVEGNDSLLFGPQTELEFQRVVRELKEADHEDE